MAIYNHPLLRRELVFRGGTCLHQVHLAAPLRYSEDLDFVRRTNDGIGSVLNALREVAAEVGMTVRGVKIGEHPKMVLRAQAEDDPLLALKIKIEIDTHETSPAREPVREPRAAVGVHGAHRTQTVWRRSPAPTRYVPSSSSGQSSRNV